MTQHLDMNSSKHGISKVSTCEGSFLGAPHDLEPLNVLRMDVVNGSTSK